MKISISLKKGGYLIHAVLLGKVRRNGTSKLGKSYDFTTCSVSYSAFGVQGVRVAEINVDSRMVEFDALEVGERYGFDFDNKGNLLNVFIED